MVALRFCMRDAIDLDYPCFHVETEQLSEATGKHTG